MTTKTRVAKIVHNRDFVAVRPTAVGGEPRQLPAQRGRRRSLVTTACGGSPVAGAIYLLLGLAVCAGIAWKLGTTHTVVRHFFYLPVIFAAARFGYWGAAVTALTAGALAQPLVAWQTPDSRQGVVDWSLRATCFLIVGMTVTYLIRRSTVPLQHQLDDLRLASDLNDAIARGQLEVRYQPIVSLTDFRVDSVEALARWNHPQRGAIGPDVFIPLAEQCGAIRALGAWVLEASCRQVVRWQRAGVLRGDRLQLGVNVSATQLAGEHFVADVERILHSTGLDPSWLILEVTETALIGDLTQSADHLSALRDLGVRVAVDDYGTGYGSLSYLRRLPVDALKIDRSFIGGLTVDHRDAAIVESVIALGHQLGKVVIAEGVETAAQVEALVALGCEYAQGYLFARPGLPEEIQQILTAELGLPTPPSTATPTSSDSAR